jgi:hypothetical protein
VLRSFVQRYHSDLPSKELHSCANGIIVVLLEKLGHSNVRIRESTSEALLFLAMNKEIGLNCVAPHLLKPPKSQVGTQVFFQCTCGKEDCVKYCIHCAKRGMYVLKHHITKAMSTISDSIVLVLIEYCRRLFWKCKVYVYIHILH